MNLAKNKFLVISFLILFISFELSAQNVEFTFLNSNSNKRLRIDLSSHLIFEEISANKWNPLGELTFENVDLKLILPVYQFNAFKTKSDFIITIPGTGQVYKLYIKDLLLKRIDKSFHTGYNFQSVQFLRKDTLFSFGGYGFWQYHNILTYFDQNSSEWETYTQLDESPERFTNRFSCYSPKNDKVYALELPRPFQFAKTKKYTFWEFDFNTKTWKRIGKINDRLALMLPETKPAGPYFLFKYQNSNLIADPESNKVYSYEGPHTKLTDALDQEITHYNKNKIFSYQKFLVGNKVNFLIDSTSIDTLFKQSKLLFKLYETEDNILYDSIFITFSLILILIALYYFIYQKRRRIKIYTDDLNSFSNFEIEILHKMYSKGFNYEFSSDELNEILGAEKKPIETQRQIRSRFISTVNQKANLLFQISNSINRQKSNLDKRYTIYKLSENFYPLLEPFFKD
ncbi:hypothetical protein [Aquirufa salirivi]